MVRLNLYANLVEGYDAESAAADRRVGQMLNSTTALLGQAGLRVTAVFRNLDESTVEEFRFIRSQADARNLAARGPLPPAVDPLSINVFLVEDFVDNRDSILGQSMGIPGPAGVHGTTASGVIVAAGNMYSGRYDPSFVGKVLAHELGHYMGLFHTTESSGLSFDPLLDTHECHRDSTEFAFGTCPDRDNLMWPFALPDSELLTRDQAWVLARSPLAQN